MSVEEAVELILSGDGLTPCPGCEGKGYLPAVKVNHYSVAGDLVMTTEMPQLCARCGGMMNLLKDEYKQACKLLSRPVPWPGALVIKPLEVKVG